MNGVVKTFGSSSRCNDAKLLQFVIPELLDGLVERNMYLESESECENHSSGKTSSNILCKTLLNCETASVVQ